MTTEEQVIHDEAQLLIQLLEMIKDSGENIVHNDEIDTLLRSATNICDTINPPPKPFELFVNAGDTYTDQGAAERANDGWAVFGINWDGEELSVRKIKDGKVE